MHTPPRIVYFSCRFYQTGFYYKILNMKYKLIQIIKFQLILLQVSILSFITSCKPEDDIKNPANYELYISISADKTPAVSPDGNLIAYYHSSLEVPEPENYPTGLYIMRFDGTERKLVVRGMNYSPSWSPDGQWLVFTSNGTLQIINLQGDSTRVFQGVNNVPLSFPDWSQDGRSILFNSSYVNGGGVFICDPLFLTVRQIFNQYQFSGFSARWSSNGDKIIYQKVSHTWEGGEIFIIDTLGKEDNRITNDNMDDREPTISPNGGMIACSKNVCIYVMNSDGTNQHKLDYGQHPNWSLDSKSIYYSNANQDFTKEVLWKIDINGKNKVQLTY